MIFLTPISFGVMTAVLIWFFTQKSDAEQAGRVERIWAQREAWGEPVCRKLINHEVFPQMTPEMARLAWGNPDSTETDPANATEVWLYKNDSRITFKNGLVIQVDGTAPATSQKNPVWLYIALLFALAMVISAITLLVIYLVR
jgi:hypothetical protein